MKKQAGLTLIELLIVAGILGILSTIVYDVFSDSGKERRAAQEKEHQDKINADRQPRKVSEANGCEVWAFKPGERWQYFTRCGAATQTTNVWEECRTVSMGKTTRQECTPHSVTFTQEPRQ